MPQRKMKAEKTPWKMIVCKTEADEGLRGLLFGFWGQERIRDWLSISLESRGLFKPTKTSVILNQKWIVTGLCSIAYNKYNDAEAEPEQVKGYVDIHPSCFTSHHSWCRPDNSQGDSITINMRRTTHPDTMAITSLVGEGCGPIGYCTTEHLELTPGLHTNS